MAELDLTTGDPARAEDESTTRRRRRTRTTTPSEDTPKRERKSVEGEVREMCTRVFDSWARMRYAKEDTELGDAITEESGPMTEGIVTLTDSVPVFRTPLIILLYLAVTLLAFGRVGGILLSRVQERRRQAQARAEEEAAMYENGTPIIPN